MECNKVEAFKAMSIAERKMEDKDFVAAHKFALKAQKLCPDMENISQLICVCDVHCSAERKIFGNELDCYGILQIELGASEALIKKQYRKFALLLHPDKNKFAGAEAAFMLIGEAQRVLLDKNKRLIYDLKYRHLCRPAVMKPAYQQENKNCNVPKQNVAQNNSSISQSHQEVKPKAQPGVANGKETFWTVCPFCAVSYQFYKDVVNKTLRCQHCEKPFIGYNVYAQSAQPASAATHPDVGVTEAGSETTNKKPASIRRSRSKRDFSRLNEVRKSPRGVNKMDEEGEQESKISSKANSKNGRKRAIESSEGVVESDSSPVIEVIEINGMTSRVQRRSVPTKRNRICNGSGSDDQVAINLRKKVKGSGFCSPRPSKPIGSASASGKEETKGVFNKSDGGETAGVPIKKNLGSDNGCKSDSRADTTPEENSYYYPDPEFFDFDKDRGEKCFKVGQVWAAYDTYDAMPRFYARIRKIFSPRFKVRITWLDPDPDDEDGIKWADEELPFSCGKFKNGASVYTDDRLIFSHLVSWEKGNGRDSVLIYPRKGETWALFKNWDAKLYQIPEHERKLEFEFVEVQSDYNESIGIRVAHLDKHNGFATLFCRKGENEVQIKPSEILRFSHRVPSYKMTGRERKDVPRGSYELDPAVMSTNLEETDLCKQDVKPRVIDLTSSSDDPTSPAKKSASNHINDSQGYKMEHLNDLDDAVDGNDVPDPEFFNFGDLKFPRKFEVNQIWALYNNIDGFPKYYCLIKKIDPHPNLTLHVACLDAWLPTSDMIMWKDKKMPISCGQFKVKGGRPQSYTDFTYFSHQLRVVADDPKGKKNVFSIYPQKGEIWAIYKNWRPDIAHSDLYDTKYDIVQVLYTNPLHFKVLVLEPAQALKPVFKPRKNTRYSVTKEVCRTELLSFSHRIPSFRLRDERGRRFRGFWELDPAALPDQFLYRKK